MPKNRARLLEAIIDFGTTEVQLAYSRPDQQQKREGAIAGFAACRDMADEELKNLLAASRAATAKAMACSDTRYWWHRSYELQVEWVLNVLSAAMAANGSTPPTEHAARGMRKATDIVGVAA